MIPEIAQTANLVGSSLTQASDTISGILQKIERWAKLRSETASTIRLLYLEVCRNIELLAVLGEARGEAISWNDGRIQFFVRNFDTSVMEMVLLGTEKEEVYKKLSNRGRITDKNDIKGIKDRNVQKYENVLQAIKFIYVKMDLLRKLTVEPGENELLVKVKVIERMKNIETRLLLARKILGDLAENKALA